MKFTSIKTVFVLVFFAGIISAKAQSSSSPGLHAFFKGTEADVKSSIQAGTLTFLMAGLETDQQTNAFIKKSQPYAKSFTLTVSPSASNMKECKVAFITNANDKAKWLQRFFMASGISDVEINGTKKSVEEFFKSIM